MVQSCGASCAKYFLFVLNFIFFLAGAAVLGIGIWMKVDPRFTSDIDKLLPVPQLVTTAAIIFIAFGAFVFVVGFLGCCGAVKESKCLLGFYIAFIVAVIAGELGAGIFAIVKWNTFKEDVATLVVPNLQSNYPTSTLSDVVMNQLDCCGWNNYTDFANSTFAARSGFAVPQVCCHNGNDTLSYTTCNLDAKSNNLQSKQLITTGCADALVFGKVFIGVAVGAAGLELIVLIAAICLCCAFE